MGKYDSYTQRKHESDQAAYKGGLGFLLQKAEAEAQEKSNQARLAESAQLRQSQQEHNQAMERIGGQQANTQEGYRRDQAQKMRADETRDKLKVLGIGATSADGKPLSNEAQKASNLIDSARQQLNRTEALSKKHPGAAIAQRIAPDFLADFLGGNIKDIKDTRNSTKEAMQNVYTGAAASGEQVPAFKGFAGPGMMDIVKGRDNSEGVRDAMNTLQQGYQRKGRNVTPEAMEAAGLQNDPIAQYALKQQDEAQQAAQQGRMSKMDPHDQEAYQWLQDYPDDPSAGAVKQQLARKYGNF